MSCALTVDLVAEGFTEAADGVYVRPMLTIDRAIDVFLSSGLKDTTRARYGRVLDRFCDRFPDDWDVAKVTEDDCLTFLSRYRTRSVGTRAHAEAVLGSFFRYLYMSRKIKTNPMDRVQRTRRIPAADLDVVTVSTNDVRALLAAARPGSELNCVAIAAYLGPRRKALANLKLSDYDRERQRMRFREKRGKTIWKPVPAELGLILEASIQRGDIGEDGYLIPPQGPLQRRGERDDRVIWRLVKTVADRVGVDCHVHALRAAFAVYFLETHNRDAVALQELMGHDSFETTRVYLRKLDRSSAMEPVRDLSWLGNAETPETSQSADARFQESRLVGAGGFEPPFPDPPGGKPRHTQQGDSLAERRYETWLENLKDHGP